MDDDPRGAYIHKLAMALIACASIEDRDTLEGLDNIQRQLVRWSSATDEERADAVAYLKRAEIRVPGQPIAKTRTA